MKQMKTPGLPEVTKHELCGLTVASMLGNFYDKKHLLYFKGMDRPGHSDLYVGKAGWDFCQQWHLHMWGQSHPGIGDGDGWCGDCVDVDTQAVDTQLTHSWYTGIWHTVDTQLIHSSYTVDTQAVDWYVVPLVNPDGYEYSHTNDRLWRKNRFLKRKQTKPIFPIFSTICEQGIEI